MFIKNRNIRNLENSPVKLIIKLENRLGILNIRQMVGLSRHFTKNTGKVCIGMVIAVF